MDTCSQEREATLPPLVSQAQGNTSFQLAVPQYTLGTTLIKGHSLDSWSHGLCIHSTDEAQTCKGDTRSTWLSLAELEAQGLPENGQWKTGTSGKAQ